MWTLAELSRLGVSSIGSELVSQAARSRLESVPDMGPRACHFAAFECRLDGDDERVDVSFALQGRAARAAVRHWLRSAGDQAELDGRYDACQVLLKAWAAESGPLTELGSIWIEVDLEPGRPDLPFVYFRPEHAGQFWQREHAPQVRPLLEAWAEVSAGALQQASAERLAQCIAALPEGARVLLLAPQLHRAQNAIRMSFRVSADRLLPYLERIGWNGAYEQLAQQLALCSAQHWAMPIQIDVINGELGRALSLEFTQSSENGYAERCESVLAAWLREGLCTEPRAEALLDWRYGTRQARAVEGDGGLGVEKLLDLKLTMPGDGSVRTKAYLGTLGVNRYFSAASTRTGNPGAST